MKKVLITVVLWFAVFHLNAQHNTCPFNAMDCAYGCGRHIDLNNDGYCDHSRFSPELTAKFKHKADSIASLKKLEAEKKHQDSLNAIKKNKKPVDTIKEASPKKTDKKEIQQAGVQIIKKTTDNVLQKDSPDESNINPILNKSDTIQTKQPVEVKTQVKQKKPYHPIEFSALTLFFYFLTMILYKRGIIKRYTHRKIWNTLLLLTFLVSCIFGLIVVVQLNYKIWLSAFSPLLHWHVEIGISMTLIAIIHITWHLKYFKRLFTSQNKNDGNCN